MNVVSTAVGRPIRVPKINIVPSGTFSNPAIATVPRPGTTKTYPTSMPAVSVPLIIASPSPLILGAADRARGAARTSWTST
jgi:hypothetical protein